MHSGYSSSSCCRRAALARVALAAVAFLAVAAAGLLAACNAEIASMSKPQKGSAQFSATEEATIRAPGAVRPSPALLAWRAREAMDEAFPIAEEPVIRQAALVAPAREPASGRRDERRSGAVTPEPITRLVSFHAAPFPYDGLTPRGEPFLDAGTDGRRGHRTRRGAVLWQDRTFGDDRVLLHIPAGFEPDRPAVMVVFFHGHGATLERDVLDRQQVPAQISASGANAVLVAPQFAVDARDSSAGRFWEPGGFARFLDEASERLARAYGRPGSAGRFARMPVVLVSYSGGYVPAAWSLKDMGETQRVRGVVMLDSLYGEVDTFAHWIGGAPGRFFVSAYSRYTRRHNDDLKAMLAQQGIVSGEALGPDLMRGGATFLATGAEANHTDYVTRAWDADPITDILRRLPLFDMSAPEATASLDARSNGRERRAEAEP